MPRRQRAKPQGSKSRSRKTQNSGGTSRRDRSGGSALIQQKTDVDGEIICASCFNSANSLRGKSNVCPSCTKNVCHLNQCLFCEEPCCDYCSCLLRSNEREDGKPWDYEGFSCLCCLREAE